MRISLGNWFRKGDPWIWINAGAVTISLVMVFGLLALIAVRGLSHFWPHSVFETSYSGNQGAVITLIGQEVEQEDVPAEQIRATGLDVPEDQNFVERWLVKTGNRDLGGSDFNWYLRRNLGELTYPQDIVVLERREWGNFYGYLEAVSENGEVVASGENVWPAFEERLDRALQLHEKIEDIEKGRIASINAELEALRLERRRLALDGQDTPEALADVEAREAEANAGYDVLQSELSELYEAINRDAIVMRAMQDKTQTISLAKVVRGFKPNDMGLLEKGGFYISKIWEFLSEDPREANTEGGVFPAIFGTVLMVIVMSIMVTPLGVVAAVYLREYAHQGTVTRILRIAVNNLAGVPSIVYGVFGLGFFIYFIGGGIDDVFFEEALPSPTFGTPGLLWASITLAILTLPVVIVATEEGLSRIPRSIREGSLALGATKAETLWRVVIPMASPALMTGVILAIARAAGEVAPLMLVGVVKLAPSLPLDGNYPYLHLDQKFMHLGFHIYDVGFQSPNVEAARPLVYATALLLVAVIALLNLSAVAIRNRLREKYKALEM
ncbi:phosphate ABC transporter permease PstA [Allohahella sp. A8]|uniref:phosphate ABC transporter permease PstA n=1 Tax=Allohahella sp. A8 TaxID=3141461 RepID=UPI003A8083B4